MAGARLEIFAPSLAAGSQIVYESGVTGSALVNRSLRPISRRVDLYGGNQALATGASWNMQVYDPQGVYSEDGLFWPDFRRALLVASVDDRVVFLGAATGISHQASTMGAVTTITWRDLVDDLVAQRVEGIDSDQAGGQVVIAQTSLHSVLDAYGIPTAVEDADGTQSPIPDLALWHPEQSATIRQWILPVLAALGYAVDWSAAITGGQLSRSFRVTHESRFRNRVPGLPLFTDRSLLTGKARWNDGRAQVWNVWTGRHRVFDSAEQEFREVDLEELVSDFLLSQAVVSRSIFGARRAPLDLSAMRATEAEILGHVRVAVSRRLWPHPRGKMSLAGAEASDLKIGDGFVTDFKFNSNLGRGLARVWRVIGRTVNIEDDVIEVEAEMRDARDEDYQDWAALGYPRPGWRPVAGGGCSDCRAAHRAAHRAVHRGGAVGQ